MKTSRAGAIDGNTPDERPIEAVPATVGTRVPAPITQDQSSTPAQSWGDEGLILFGADVIVRAPHERYLCHNAYVIIMPVSCTAGVRVLGTRAC